MVIFIILTLDYILFLFIIGILVGLSSGLLGVGGGFIMVPLQFFLLTSYGVDSSLALLVSFATSLAIIIPTSLSAVYKHNKKLDNILSLGIRLGIFGIFGGFIGGLLSYFLPTKLLQILFAILLFFVSVNMYLDRNIDLFNKKRDLNLFLSVFIGVFVGILSGLLGIGGGVFIVMILSSFIGFSMIESIGISSVFISLTAIGGVLSYIVSGWSKNILPYSIGYVNLVNFLGIALFSIPFAYIGANISHNISENNLKKVFSIIIFIIAIRMLF